MKPVDEKAAHQDAKVKAVTLDYLAGELRVLAETLTTTEEDCPLRHLKNINHYYMSRFLAESGWKWVCPFCGEEDSH